MRRTFGLGSVLSMHRKLNEKSHPRGVALLSAASVQIYGPIRVGEQGLKPRLEELAGVGGVGGVDHGTALKSKNSSRFG